MFFIILMIIMVIVGCDNKNIIKYWNNYYVTKK